MVVAGSVPMAPGSWEQGTTVLPGESALEVIQQDRDELLRVNATLVSVTKAVENWSKSKDYQEFVLWK